MQCYKVIGILENQALYNLYMLQVMIHDNQFLFRLFRNQNRTS